MAQSSIDLSTEKKYSKPHNGTAGFNFQILSNEIIEWLKRLDGQTIPLQQVLDSLQFMTNGCIEIKEDYIVLWLVDGVPDLSKRIKNCRYQNIGDRLLKYYPNKIIRMVHLLRYSDS